MAKVHGVFFRKLKDDILFMGCPHSKQKFAQNTNFQNLLDPDTKSVKAQPCLRVTGPLVHQAALINVLLAEITLITSSIAIATEVPN